MTLTKCCCVPSTSCDLCIYRVWSYYVKSFRKRSTYKRIQYLTFDLDLGVSVTQNDAQCPLHHVTYPATKFEVATSNRLGGDTFTRKYTIWSVTWTLGTRSYKMLPSTLIIIWPIQLHSFELLRQKVYEEIHLQEKIQYLTSEFDLGVKVTLNVVHYPLHHVTYSATKFEVATSKGLGGDVFTGKFNIWPLTLTLGSRSHEMLPSTLYIMCPIQLQSLELLRLTV